MGTGGITNDGTITIKGPLTLESNLLNNDLLDWTGSFGLMTVTSTAGVTITNASAGTMNLLTNSNTSQVDIVNAGTVNSTGTPDFNDDFQNTATGTIDVTVNSFKVSGTMTNAGAITVTAPGRFDVFGTLTQNGSVTVNSALFLNSGLTNGTGAFVGSNVINNVNSTWAPGTSPGCMTFANGFDNNGTLEIEVGGPTPCSDHDQLQITGTADLGQGALSVSFLNNYAPPNDLAIVIIDATTINGQFNNVSPALPGEWEVRYDFPNTGEVSLFYSVPCNLAPTITSVQAGLWNDPATWSDGVIPDECNDVVIDHDVILNTNQTGNFKTLSIGSGGSLETRNDAGLVGTGGITNDGLLTVAGRLSLESDVTNNTTLTWGAAGFIGPVISSTAGVTITNTTTGTVNVINNAGTSQVDIVNHGAFTSTANPDFSDDFQNTATGTIDITANNFTISGTMTNAGSITITDPGRFGVNGTLTQNGSVTTIGAGSLFINNGLTQGTGAFAGPRIINNVNGTWAPGTSPGCMTFSDGFDNNGTLEIEVDGPTACTDYDQLQVTGTADVSNSTLAISISYTPPSPQAFIIIDADALIGPGTVNPALPANWQLVYDYPATGQLALIYGNLCDLNNLQVSTTGQSCPGVADGSITASADCILCSGIEYSISPDPNGVGAQLNNGVFTNLPAGTYTVTATDAGDGSCTISEMNVNVAAGIDNTPPTIACPTNLLR